MTRKPFTIPNPCSEPWEAMRSVGHARFCEACDKHVFDLSALTEREVRGLAALTGGRFCASQVIHDGVLLLRSEPVSPRRSASRAAIVAGALATAACGSPDEAARPPENRAAMLPGPIERPTTPPPGPKFLDLGVAPSDRASEVTGLEPVSVERRTGAVLELDHANAPRSGPVPDIVAGSDRDGAHGEVFFARGKATMEAASVETLAAIAKALAAHPWIKLRLDGHTTEDEGSATEREALRLNRARHVLERLLALGIGAERVRLATVPHAICGVGDNPMGARRVDLRVIEAKIALGTVNTEKGPGMVDVGEVGAVFARRKGAIKGCYEKALRTADVQGKVVLRCTLGAHGRLDTVEAIQDTTGDDAFVACLAEKIRLWRFEPPAGGSVTFTIPLVLHTL